MSAHTPGPWTAIRRYYRAVPHDDERSGFGWEVEGPEMPTLRGMFARAADAHLVAASPDMLDAIERLLEYYADPLPQHMIDELRDCVAKAKGEADADA